MTSWDAFYDEAERRGPSLLLARAMNLAGNKAAVRQAVDLGCGAGMEAQQLMLSGWDVLAVDNEPEAITRTIANCSGPYLGTLTTCLSDFECLLALPRSNLIHAGLALPFCRPKSFKQLWDQVLHALEPGGVFVGHFFGTQHGWSKLPHLTFHSEQDIRRMCKGLEVTHLRETQIMTQTPNGPLNWHRLNLIVQKPY
ncbi:class I SAM-dependent methyltransferase [Pseudomonas fragi]|uniref:class I SAM-dependent methyltransferase n=1 Tax=Pseudomonas fragi TaxID=296 RepID=UPI0021C0869E|nr:class I SAM-dependent methyltransferase [Pseudomonas fragi]UXL37057.1 class I SAM-dependent methyltransferase [Pseudomonas fragi]